MSRKTQKNPFGKLFIELYQGVPLEIIVFKMYHEKMSGSGWLVKFRGYLEINDFGQPQTAISEPRGAIIEQILKDD